MKFADFLRGVATVLITDVNKVFDEATTAVQAAPFLPPNIKSDLVTLVADAKAEFNNLVGVASTVAGQVVADAVDDMTTLLMNTAQAVATSGGDMAKLTVAERAVLMQTWVAMKAQGDVLIAQLHAGINPTAQPAPVPAPAPVTPPAA